MIDHALALENTTAKYPIKKTIVKPITLEQTSSQTKSIHTGIMPNRVVLGMVDGNAFTGVLKKNPFNFQHFNLESIALKVASKNVPYSKPLIFKPLLPGLNVIEGYNTLYTGIREAPNDITLHDYKNGYFLLCFDLTADMCLEDHYNILKDASLEVELEFNPNQPMNSSIKLIAYLEFDSIIQITKSRNILVDNA